MSRNKAANVFHFKDKCAHVCRSYMDMFCLSVIPSQFYLPHWVRWHLSGKSYSHTSLMSFWEMPWLLSTSFCISSLTCTCQLNAQSEMFNSSLPLCLWHTNHFIHHVFDYLAGTLDEMFSHSANSPWTWVAVLRFLRTLNASTSSSFILFLLWVNSGSQPVDFLVLFWMKAVERVFFISTLQSFYLGMSLQNMNQMQLVPKKDYVANRLVSGALQLARNTSLFLDETQLEQGQLDTTGEAFRNHKGRTQRTDCS